MSSRRISPLGVSGADERNAQESVHSMDVQGNEVNNALQWSIRRDFVGLWRLTAAREGHSPNSVHMDERKQTLDTRKSERSA